MPGIKPLHNHHAGVLAQGVAELAVANVQGVDFPGASLEHAVGKAAG